jgi:hypothetical protein
MHHPCVHAGVGLRHVSIPSFCSEFGPMLSHAAFTARLWRGFASVVEASGFVPYNLCVICGDSKGGTRRLFWECVKWMLLRMMIRMMATVKAHKTESMQASRRDHDADGHGPPLHV